VLLNPAPPKALLLDPKPEPEDTLRLPMLFPPLPPKPELMPVLGRATLAPPPGRLPAPAPSPVPLPGRLPAPAPPPGRLPAPIFPAVPPPGRLPAPPATAAAPPADLQHRRDG